MNKEDEQYFTKLVARRLEEARVLGLAGRGAASFLCNELAAAGFATTRSGFFGRAGSRASTAYRFFLQHTPEPNTGCWLWTGPLNNQGYGLFVGEKNQGLAHRWAFTAYGGRLRGKQTVDHLCGQPACVNPDHLEAVSRRENTLRMLETRALARAHVIAHARGYIADIQPKRPAA